MTTINPVQTPVTQVPAFKGVKDKMIKKVMCNVSKLTPEEAFMEQVAGMTCAAKTKNADVIKEIIMRETMLGHFDFVKGINEYLAKNAAKKAY